MSSKTLYRSQSEQTFTLTPVDIYKLANREDDIGIFGYRPAKKYFDYNEVKWFQKRADILKKHKANWPPDDWPTDKESGAKKQPQRKNFIDDVIEWSKSCYDSKRAEEIKDNLASKGHPIPEPGHDKPKQKLETEKRKKYLEREKELEAKRKQMEEIPEWKVNAIDQVKDIYTGKITNWKEVGGKDAQIVVVSREDGSGTRDGFQDIVGFESEELTGDAQISDGSGNIKTTVQGNENAIGYISFGYLDDSINSVKIDGVEPKEENVYNDSYPISRPFLLVTKGEAADDAKAFIDYILSDDGQSTIEEEGFMSVNEK